MSLCLSSRFALTIILTWLYLAGATSRLLLDLRRQSLAEGANQIGHGGVLAVTACVGVHHFGEVAVLCASLMLCSLLDCWHQSKSQVVPCLLLSDARKGALNVSQAGFLKRDPYVCSCQYCLSRANSTAKLALLVVQAAKHLVASRHS